MSDVRIKSTFGSSFWSYQSVKEKKKSTNIDQISPIPSQELCTFNTCSCFVIYYDIGNCQIVQHFFILNHTLVTISIFSSHKRNLEIAQLHHFVNSNSLVNRVHNQSREGGDLQEGELLNVLPALY